MSSKTAKVKVKTHPVVVMEAEVARKIRQHSRTSMKAEVCGILIGATDDERTLIEACIPGINAAQGGAHVTFTQDTWEHIYKIKDEQFPDKKIVGWYHSHPGFGVFLSEHDLFIQDNFFSSPQQVAWVYDPHTDEEGCFGWVGGKTEKLNGVRFGYSQAIDVNGSSASAVEDASDSQFDPPVKLLGQQGGIGSEPLWVTWTIRSLGVIAVLGVGFALGYFFVMRQVDQSMRELEQMAPVLASCRQVAEHPVESCLEILDRAGVVPGSTIAPPAQLQSPVQPVQQQLAPAKPQPTPGVRGNNARQ